MKKTFRYGAYPTMITPYNRDNTLDIGAVRALVDWYWEKGCDGIFAVCQSSEIHYLTLAERVLLAETVRLQADRLAAAEPGRAPLTVVASGHISDRFADQVTELNAIADTGIDALVLISNRMDIENTGDASWIADCDKLLAALPPMLPLGVYECPKPYKRLLTEEMLQYLVGTGRFAFIKDTCCSAPQIAQRILAIDSTPTPADGYKPALFNANAQTLLPSLRSGAMGYCGIMANFHPDLYAWLCKNDTAQPQKSELIATFLGTAAFIECGLAYPCVAKYHLNRSGVKMTSLSRSCDESKMTDYDFLCIDNMEKLAAHFRQLIAE